MENLLYLFMFQMKTSKTFTRFRKQVEAQSENFWAFCGLGQNRLNLITLICRKNLNAAFGGEQRLVLFLIIPWNNNKTICLKHT